MKNARLARTIRQGKWRYIFLYGVLGWGIGSAILYSLFLHITGSAHFTSSIKLALILFPIAGFFWGLVMWRILNKKHQSQKHKISDLI